MQGRYWHWMVLPLAGGYWCWTSGSVLALDVQYWQGKVGIGNGGWMQNNT